MIGSLTSGFRPGSGTAWYSGGRFGHDRTPCPEPGVLRWWSAAEFRSALRAYHAASLPSPNKLLTSRTSFRTPVSQVSKTFETDGPKGLDALRRGFVVDKALQPADRSEPVLENRMIALDPIVFLLSRDMPDRVIGAPSCLSIAIDLAIAARPIRDARQRPVERNGLACLAHESPCGVGRPPCPPRRRYVSTAGNGQPEVDQPTILADRVPKVAPPAVQLEVRFVRCAGRALRS